MAYLAASWQRGDGGKRLPSFSPACPKRQQLPDTFDSAHVDLYGLRVNIARGVLLETQLAGAVLAPDTSIAEVAPDYLRRHSSR